MTAVRPRTGRELRQRFGRNMDAWWRGVLVALLTQLVGVMAAALMVREAGLVGGVLLFGLPVLTGLGVSIGFLVFFAAQIRWSTRKAFVAAGVAANVGWLLAGLAELWLPAIGATSLTVVLVTAQRLAPGEQEHRRPNHIR